MLEQGGPGSISKEDASITICPVYNGRELLCANDEDGLLGAGCDKLTGDFQRVKEAGTRGTDVETNGSFRSDFRLHKTGRGREKHVGRHGGDDNHVDVFGGDSGVLERGLGGFCGEIAGGLRRGGDAAFADPGAGHDPLVASFHQTLQFCVGQNGLWNVGACSDNGGAKIGHSG